MALPGGTADSVGSGSAAVAMTSAATIAQERHNLLISSCTGGVQGRAEDLGWKPCASTKWSWDVS